ncbi:MAG: ATP-binding protein, partial [Spirochaetaceae bacterium]|nr:ATP-binding protein [Spirochaetaceae bacterium]
NNLDWEWKKYPVIRLDLNAVSTNGGVETLKQSLRNLVKNAAICLNIELRGDLPSDQFCNLILDVSRKYGEKTVVIVDEYDKPLLNTIDVPDIHIKMRDELKSFYGVLKSSDPYLRFVFLTGVTKFAHVSIFSDLNHLKDITLHPLYADLCGITQEELERDFVPEIDAVLQEKNRDRETYLAELRRFYNGYRFSGKALTVYNPFGLLNHFADGGTFSPYWYETGTPTFLLKLIANQNINILDLNDMRVAYEDFSKFAVETMKALPVLYQSGYLTITDYDDELRQFTLDYPNIEVSSCFAKSLLEYNFQPSDEKARALYVKLPAAFFKGDVEGVMDALRSFFGTIPSEITTRLEYYYETAVHLVFTMLGMHCRSEVRIASGRIDTLVETKDYVYCFEFKLKGSVKQALEQIDTKEYLLPWKGSGKTLFKIGVKFDHRRHNIGVWEFRKC